MRWIRRMGIVGVVAMGLLYLLIIENPSPTRPLVDLGLIWTRAVQIGVLRVARAAKRTRRPARPNG